jgi:hypothetical protein
MDRDRPPREAACAEGREGRCSHLASAGGRGRLLHPGNQVEEARGKGREGRALGRSSKIKEGRKDDGGKMVRIQAGRGGSLSMLFSLSLYLFLIYCSFVPSYK